MKIVCFLKIDTPVKVLIIFKIVATQMRRRQRTSLNFKLYHFEYIFRGQVTVVGLPNVVKRAVLIKTSFMANKKLKKNVAMFIAYCALLTKTLLTTMFSARLMFL